MRAAQDTQQQTITKCASSKYFDISNTLNLTSVKTGPVHGTETAGRITPTAKVVHEQAAAHTARLNLNPVLVRGLARAWCLEVAPVRQPSGTSRGRVWWSPPSLEPILRSAAGKQATTNIASDELTWAYMAYSWLETFQWSSRVMPSPMADFISRDSDGSTLMGGKISFVCSCLSR